jgi:hypothetical protein
MTTTPKQPPSIEDAFASIEQGVQYKKQKKPWEAAQAFAQAQRVLDDLAYAPSNKRKEDQTKIVQLYQQQAREYLDRSREVLLEALRNEMQADQQAQDTLKFQSLSQEEASARLQLFAHLFAPNGIQTGTSTNDTKQFDLGSSIEQRLLSLNENLPHGFKTSEERMRNINRGLHRLGLSLYSAQDEPRPPLFAVEKPQSTEDQINAIIAQAKDDVAVQKQSPHVLKTQSMETTSTDEVENLHDSDSAEDASVSDQISAATPEDKLAVKAEKELSLQAIQDIQEKVAEAQAKLAVLVAMFDLDTNADAEIQFDAAGGKAALRRARALLLEASQLWKQDLADD